MMRALTCLALGALIGVGSVLAEPEKDKRASPPKDKRGEKIDGKVDRTLTGKVEKVEATDEKTGALKMCSSGPAKSSPYHYTFRIDEKTKFLTSKGEPLPHGLKSRLLSNAEVMVEFVDQKPGSDKPAPSGVHFARKVQLIRPDK